MKTRTTTLALVLVLGPMLGACRDNPSLVAPEEPALATADLAAGGTLDLAALDAGDPDGSLFDKLSAEIPGFGGFWFDRACNLNVVLTDLEQSELAKDVLSPYLRRYVESNRCGRDASVLVQHGEYTWTQLSSWLRVLRPVSRIRGVSRIGISVPLNHIFVEVNGRPAANEVLRFVAGTDVPVAVLKFVLAAAGGR